MKTFDTLYGKISCTDNNFLNEDPVIDDTLNHYIKKSDNILDIGANTGYYSIMCSYLNSNANIYSFESKKSKFTILENNMRQNMIQNVTILNTAIGEENTRFDITLDSLNLLGCDMLRIGTGIDANRIIRGGLYTINKYRPVIILKSSNIELKNYKIYELNNDNYLAKPI
jgi:precorrin-6B methylase 2